MNDPRSLGSPSPLRARRNVRWIALGILVICLGGLGSGFLFVSVADAHAVIRVNRTVYRGQVIQAADLGAVTIGTAIGVETVPADRAADLVGQTAITDLPSGSLLVPGAVGPPELPADTNRVGLRLSSGRIPISPLPPGTPVLLVEIAKDGQGEPAGASVLALVATAPLVQTDGSSVLDVSVPATEGERIARLAAADLLVLVRRAGG